MFVKMLQRIEKSLTLSIIKLTQNIIMIQTNQWFKKKKDETACVAINEFVVLRPKTIIFRQIITIVAPWCSGCHYYTTSFD